MPPYATFIFQMISGPPGPFASSSTWDGRSEGGRGVPIFRGSEAQISTRPFGSCMTFPPQNEYLPRGYSHASCACIEVTPNLKIRAPRKRGRGSRIRRLAPLGRGVAAAVAITARRVIWLPEGGRTGVIPNHYHHRTANLHALTLSPIARRYRRLT